MLTNVPGSYTVQIWWKGDPGIENFVIRFTNEEVMKKWSAAVDLQRKNCALGQQSATAEVGDFAWMQNQAAPMENPYAEQDDDDNDEEYDESSPVYPPGQYGYDTSRNGSNASLRSRSTTGESTQSLAGMVRAPPPRFPMGMQNPPLSLLTQLPGQAASPSQRAGDSYFSPTGESPASSRTSQSSSMFPFPRQGTPQSGWEDNNRYTAPAATRGSRESQQSSRNSQRPSINGSTTQPSSAQQRSRSYSTPDANGPNPPPTRRLPAVPAVPGIPAHLNPAHDGGIARSSSNSPSNGLPMRSNTQSPGVQRERLQNISHPINAPQYMRSHTTPIPMSAMDGPITSPPLHALPPVPPPLHALPSIPVKAEVPLPTQLKVKVNCDGNYVTLVVAFNITYQSLIDRIDAKVGRFSTNAIARGTMRLRYRDEDGDFVTIESDDDIQIAFQEWREVQENLYTGQLGEIELFCASVET